jgi:ankyrin repeat protein
MANLEDHRRFVIHIINNRKEIDEKNITELNNYLLNNRLSLKDLNDKDFDILCFALDKRISFSLLKFIIQQCPYETYNYTFYFTNRYRQYCGRYKHEIRNHIYYGVPLFMAIQNGNFEVAKFLIREKKADINYTTKEDDNIITFIYNNNFSFSEKELNFIIRKGFYAKGFPKELIDNLLLNDYNDKVLQTIFELYFMDNHFILHMILLSQRRVVLTDTDLDLLIQKEKSKIVVDDVSYSNALKSNNLKYLTYLLNYDCRPRERIIDTIHKLDLWSYADRFHEYEDRLDFIRAMVGLQIYSSQRSNLEELFWQADHDKDIGFTMGLVLNGLYRRTHIDIYGPRFENFLLASSKVDSLTFMNANLSEIMSDSKDRFIFEKIRRKNDEEFIKRMKRRIERTKNPVSKKSLIIYLNEILEIENPLSVTLFKHRDSSFLSLLINIAIKVQRYDVVQFLLQNHEVSHKININVPDRNGEYPLTTALTMAKSDKKAIDILQYLIDHMEKSEKNHFTLRQALSLLTIALTTKKYMAIKYLLKQLEKLMGNEAFGDDSNLDPVYQKMYRRYCQNLSSSLIIHPSLQFNQNTTLSERYQKNDALSSNNIDNENYDNKSNSDKGNDDKGNKDKDNNGDNNDKKKNLIHPIISSNISGVKKKKNKKKTNNYQDSTNDKKRTEYPKYYNFSGIVFAYLFGGKDNLKLLLGKGWFVNELDEYGYGILHFIVLKEDIDLIQDIMNHTDLIVSYRGNDLNRGHSALDIAMNCCGKDMVLLLLRSPALIVNQTENECEIPLFILIKSELFSIEDKIEMVRILLDRGSEVDVIDSQGRSVLAYAIQTGSLPLVQSILDHGADANFIDENKVSPLNYAIQTQSESIVGLLLDHGADVNFIDFFEWSPLAYAITEAYFPVVKLLVDHGADANYRVVIDDESKEAPVEECLFVYAVDQYEFRIVQYLLEHGGVEYDFTNRENLCHLMPKVFSGVKKGLFPYLLKNYIKVEDLPLEAVEDLVFHGHLDELMLLLEHGFDINKRNDDGSTLLSNSIVKNDFKIMDLLLEKGASLQPLNENIELIRFVILPENQGDKFKLFAVLEKLIEHGLDVNASDKDGETLLIYSVIRPDIDFIQFFLEHGADPCYVNRREGQQAPRSVEQYNEEYHLGDPTGVYRQIQDLLNRYCEKKKCQRRQQK